MVPWLVAPAHEGRLLAGGRTLGPTAYLIAIMTFTMLLIAAAGLALANAARVVAADAEHRFTLEVPAGANDLARIAETVRGVPGVAQVQAVPREELERTLERWLGSSARDPGLPIPALVEFDLVGQQAQPAALDRIARVVPGGRVVRHDASVKPLLSSLRALQALAIGLVLLMGIATAAAVVLAARGALDTHRSTIEVMHGIGATDLQVTRLFQRRIALDALIGAAVGSGAAALALLMLGTGGAALAGELAGQAPLRGIDILLIALVPPAVVLLATLVARWAVLATLRKAL